MAIVLCALAAACYGTGISAVGQSGRELGLGRKVVASKVDPSTLVAVDRTSWCGVRGPLEAGDGG